MNKNEVEEAYLKFAKELFEFSTGVLATKLFPDEPTAATIVATVDLGKAMYCTPSSN